MAKKQEKNILNFKTNNFIEIEIEDCNIKEYDKEISKHCIDIPYKLLLKEEIDMNDIRIKKQKIIILSFKKNRIIITFNENEIRILEISCINEDDFIDETFLKINESINITKYLYNTSLDTILCKTYPNDNPSTQSWTLEKQEAINLTKSLIYFISHIIDINEIMNFEQIKQTINELEKEKQKQIIPN